jgi:hypothetical protein
MIPPSRRSDRHYGVDRLPRVRATGITACLSNSGALEHAREMAAHESPRTTKVNDRARIGSPKSRMNHLIGVLNASIIYRNRKSSSWESQHHRLPS